MISISSVDGNPGKNIISSFPPLRPSLVISQLFFCFENAPGKSIIKSQTRKLFHSRFYCRMKSSPKQKASGARSADLIFTSDQNWGIEHVSWLVLPPGCLEKPLLRHVSGEKLLRRRCARPSIGSHAPLCLKAAEPTLVSDSPGKPLSCNDGAFRSTFAGSGCPGCP